MVPTHKLAYSYPVSTVAATVVEAGNFIDGSKSPFFNLFEKKELKE